MFSPSDCELWFTVNWISEKSIVKICILSNNERSSTHRGWHETGMKRAHRHVGPSSWALQWVRISIMRCEVHEKNDVWGVSVYTSPLTDSFRMDSVVSVRFLASFVFLFFPELFHSPEQIGKTTNFLCGKGTLSHRMEKCVFHQCWTYWNSTKSDPEYFGNNMKSFLGNIRAVSFYCHHESCVTKIHHQSLDLTVCKRLHQYWFSRVSMFRTIKLSFFLVTVSKHCCDHLGSWHRQFSSMSWMSMNNFRYFSFVRMVLFVKRMLSAQEWQGFHKFPSCLELPKFLWGFWLLLFIPSWFVKVKFIAVPELLSVFVNFNSQTLFQWI